MNNAGFRNDGDEPVPKALVGTHDNLERRRVEKSATPKVDHQQPVRAQIRLGAFHGGFKIFRVGNIKLAEDVQCNDRVKILTDKSCAMVRNNGAYLSSLSMDGGRATYKL